MNKIKYTFSILSLAPLMFIIIAAFQSEKNTSDNPNEGKIKFSHSLHSDLVDCQTCHSAVVESSSLITLQLPNHDNCPACHSVDNDNECSTCHINDVYEPLVRKESELIFNHKFHLENNKMDCESCHKGLTEVDYSWQAVGINLQWKIVIVVTMINLLLQTLASPVTFQRQIYYHRIIK